MKKVAGEVGESTTSDAIEYDSKRSCHLRSAERNRGREIFFMEEGGAAEQLE